ncbi:MAG: flagellar basal body-associated FliL family protein [Armatimonadetes bacterium]|nr:flagellar basal body-associated FliL family protein [Armatimonadota bacterium]
MSEKPAAAADAPKKKGKMPIILILALVIGGGGFFMMKGKKKPNHEPEIKLGEIVAFEKEFLVNLREQDSYLRTEIAVQLKEKVDPKAFEKVLPAIQNAFVMRLGGLSKADVVTMEDRTRLKRILARDANEVLKLVMPAKEEVEETKKEKEKREEHEAEMAKPGYKPEFPEFDSDTGPILKIYFTSFATQ